MSLDIPHLLDRPAKPGDSIDSGRGAQLQSNLNGPGGYDIRSA